MNLGATTENPMTTGCTESRRLYYRLRRQRYSEMTATSGTDDVVRERAATHKLAECERQIAKLDTDLAGMRDLAMRARAELDNARKRFKREKAETIKYANERLLRDLIGTVDNLERAIESAENAKDVKGLRDGVTMVFNQFIGTLQQKGLEIIASDGQIFDPHFHEAVSTEERDDIEDNQIIGTLQKGYILNGRVVRPAMVRVARAKLKPLEALPQEVEEPEEAQKPEAVEEREAAEALEAVQEPEAAEVPEVAEVPEAVEEPELAEAPVAADEEAAAEKQEDLTDIDTEDTLADLDETASPASDAGEEQAGAELDTPPAGETGSEAPENQPEATANEESQQPPPSPSQT